MPDLSIPHIEAMYACLVASNHETKERELVLSSPKLHAAHKRRQEILSLGGFKPLKTSWSPRSKAEEQVLNPHSYYGMVYYRKTGPRQLELMFAHRGTCFNKMGNVLADVEILERKAPKILSEAVEPYVERSIQSLVAKGWEIRKVTHAGFSLGGFIAGAMAAKSDDPNVHAVTFDAPGCAYMLKSDPVRQTVWAGHVTNYVTDVNLVNACNRHLGDVYQFSMFKGARARASGFNTSTSASGFELTRDTFPHALHEIAHALKTHDLAAVAEKLEQDVRVDVTAVYKWPTADAKLTYGPESALDRHHPDDDVIAISAKFASHTLWHVSRGRNGNSGHGLTNLGYQCSSTVFYSADEYAADQRATAASAVFVVLCLTIGMVAARYGLQHTNQPTAADQIQEPASPVHAPRMSA
jgi:hypothetical protein